MLCRAWASVGFRACCSGRRRALHLDVRQAAAKNPAARIDFAHTALLRSNGDRIHDARSAAPAAVSCARQIGIFDAADRIRLARSAVSVATTIMLLLARSCASLA
jgi:hypothetical protein